MAQVQADVHQIAMPVSEGERMSFGAAPAFQLDVGDACPDGT